MKLRIGIALILVATLMSQCKKDSDEAKPTIEIESVGFFENDTIWVGEDLMLDIDFLFSDDESLNAMRLSIEQESTASSNCQQISAYVETKFEDLAGENDSYNLLTQLPDSLEQNLNITCEVFDTAGNLTTTRINAIISNEKVPQMLGLTTVPESGSCVINVGIDSSFEIQVEASCVDLISTINFYLEQDGVLNLYDSHTGVNVNYIYNSFNISVPLEFDELNLKTQLISEAGISKWSDLSIDRE